MQNICVKSVALGGAIGFSAAQLVRLLSTRQSSTSLLRGWNLKYFGIPALGEPIRILLHLSGEPGEDQLVTGDVWRAQYKANTKWGQLPVLTLADGTELTQSRAILRFLGKLVKHNGKPFYPSDPALAFQVDEMIDVFEDVRSQLVRTFRIADQKEKEDARAALFAPGGDAATLVAKIEGCVPGKFLVGDSPTIADVWAFFFIRFLTCGFWDGLSEDITKPYPKLLAVGDNLLSELPSLKEYYQEKAAANPLYKGFC